MMTHHLLTVNVGAVRGSGQWGSSSASNERRGVIVTIDLHGMPKGSRERAYLAKSGCSQPSRTPWKRLHPVRAGKSTTFVPHLGIDRLRAKPHAVVITAAVGAPVACGDFQT